MKRLQHENLNEFIGLCPDPDHFCILTAYCAKGSLEVGIYVVLNRPYYLREAGLCFVCLNPFFPYVDLLAKVLDDFFYERV